MPFEVALLRPAFVFPNPKRQRGNSQDHFFLGIRLFELKLMGRHEPKRKAPGTIPLNWLLSLSRLRPKLNVNQLSGYKFFRELAKLGGFFGRKSDGEPGWQTIWRGYQKMHSLLDAMTVLGQI